MAEIVRDLPDHAKPLCPNAISLAGNPLHQLRVRVLDQFSDAAEKDDHDNFLSEAVEHAYGAAAYGPVGDRMDLFRHSTAVWHLARNVTVESWWWQCPVCGFVLPTNRIPR